MNTIGRLKALYSVPTQEAAKKDTKLTKFRRPAIVIYYRKDNKYSVAVFNRMSIENLSLILPKYDIDIDNILCISDYSNGYYTSGIVKLD